jgi:hypothetical protein
MQTHVPAGHSCLDPIALRKAEFWQLFAAEPLSARQKAILYRFLDGFEGNLTARKRAALANAGDGDGARNTTGTGS